MTHKRPYVLSIAGYDPSGGAGVLADVKTFENTDVYGFAVTTGITYQNENKFDGVKWLTIKQIKNQIYPIIENHKIEFVKIGLIENFKTLVAIIELLKAHNSKIKIIWDPVLRATAGYDFHRKIPKKYLKYILKNIYLITPNWLEIQSLSNEKDAIIGAEKIAKLCKVYLKGGHNIETPATDLLFIEDSIEVYHPTKITELEKHGTGCVLSSAITAYLANGKNLFQSCELAKEYTYKFLVSNSTRLGYHSL
jgi:hydroxymethylpyrimidine/phosphomethylpyrimidine kinase